MRQISPHVLFVGDRGDVRDLVALRRAGVSAIVDLAVNESPLNPPREMVYCRFPLDDGAGNSRAVLRSAMEAVATLLRNKIQTLVVCSAGMSRAPSVAAGAVSLVTGVSARECLAEVVRGGPADVSPGFWGELVAVVADLKRVGF